MYSFRLLNVFYNNVIFNKDKMFLLSIIKNKKIMSSLNNALKTVDNSIYNNLRFEKKGKILNFFKKNNSYKKEIKNLCDSTNLFTLKINLEHSGSYVNLSFDIYITSKFNPNIKTYFHLFFSNRILEFEVKSLLTLTKRYYNTSNNLLSKKIINNDLDSYILFKENRLNKQRSMTLNEHFFFSLDNNFPEYQIRYSPEGMPIFEYQ